MTDSSRNLTPAMATAVDSEIVRPAVLVQIGFDSGNINVWSGLVDLSFQGENFEGKGGLLEVAPAVETVSVRATGTVFVLSGMKLGMIAATLAEPYRNRPARMWLGERNDAGQLVDDPYLVFEGRADVMMPALDGETSKITVTAESKLIDLTRPRHRRYTPEDQKAEFPADLGLDFVAGLQQEQIRWLVS